MKSGEIIMPSKEERKRLNELKKRFEQESLELNDSETYKLID